MLPCSCHVCRRSACCLPWQMWLEAHSVWICTSLDCPNATFGLDFLHLPCRHLLLADTQRYTIVSELGKCLSLDFSRSASRYLGRGLVLCMPVQGHTIKAYEYPQGALTNTVNSHFCCSRFCKMGWGWGVKGWTLQEFLRLATSKWRCWLLINDFTYKISTKLFVLLSAEFTTLPHCQLYETWGIFPCYLSGLFA